MNRRSNILLLSLCAVFIAASVGQAQKRVGDTQMHEYQMQNPEMLRFSVMPKYPETALARGVQGDVVALVRITETGEIEKLEIIKGEDADLKEAVSEAVKTWKYAAPTDGHRTGGTLSFRFTVEGGKGKVRFAPPTEYYTWIDFTDEKERRPE